jgi:hypothetical protein
MPQLRADDAGTSLSGLLGFKLPFADPSAQCDRESQCLALFGHPTCTDECPSGHDADGTRCLLFGHHQTVAPSRQMKKCNSTQEQPLTLLLSIFWLLSIFCRRVVSNKLGCSKSDASAPEAFRRAELPLLIAYVQAVSLSRWLRSSGESGWRHGGSLQAVPESATRTVAQRN